MKVIQKLTIGEVHFQHRIWRNSINFYKDELKIFQERLEEIASKNTKEDIRIKIEQFQNKLIIQHNELDKLEHLVNVSEDKAVESGQIHIRRIDYEATDNYLDIKSSMEDFEKLYNELKKDFYRFLLDSI
jgi:hypothetical protein